MADRLRLIIAAGKRPGARCLRIIAERPDVEVVAVLPAAPFFDDDPGVVATEMGLEVLRGRPTDLVPHLRELDADLLVSVQYDRLVPGSVLELPRRGGVNLHFGLLPRYGGCHPAVWPILNGERIAGVTLHRMTDRFDEGDLLAQATVAIDDTTTARELYEGLADTAEALFEEVVDDLLAERLVARAQDPRSTLYYGRDSIDFPELARVRWQDDAATVVRRARAADFPPFQRPTAIWGGSSSPGPVCLTVGGWAHFGSSVWTGVPGTPEGVTGSSLGVRCGGGTLVLIEAIDDRPATAWWSEHGEDGACFH